MRGLSGNIIAVTGAAGGIGEAICLRLLAEGAEVYALDYEAPSVGRPLTVDVTERETIDAALATIIKAEGRVDGLVVAAGVVEDDVPAEEMDLAVWDRTVNVNLRGLFLTCQVFGRKMLEQGKGNIVNISSMSGNHVVNVPQKQCAYNASKAGVTALTKSLASEWAGRGVRVNAIAPGYVATPLLSEKKHQFEQWLSATPQARMAEPSEIASAVAFLLSEEAAYFCGSELLVDGGYSLQ